MSDTLKLANSIWPNGMQVDSDGHAVFYPLGTNKVEVPTSSAQWPKGNKLISPFVYKDDKLIKEIPNAFFIEKVEVKDNVLYRVSVEIARGGVIADTTKILNDKFEVILETSELPKKNEYRLLAYNTKPQNGYTKCQEEALIFLNNLTFDFYKMLKEKLDD